MPEGWKEGPLVQANSEVLAVGEGSSSFDVLLWRRKKKLVIYEKHEG